MDKYTEFGIPFLKKDVKINQTSKRVYAQKGVVIEISKYNWMTDGPVKRLEEGLPLISESSLSKNSYKLAKKTLEEPEEESNDLSDTSRSNFKSYERTNPAKINKRKTIPKTGIVPAPQSEDIIDGIGKLSLRSVSRRGDSTYTNNPFSPISRRDRIVPPPAKKDTTRTVKSQLNRILDSDAYVYDLDEESLFSLDNFYEPNAPHDQNSGSITSYSSYYQEPHESLMIDPHKNDIIWIQTTKLQSASISY